MPDETLMRNDHSAMSITPTERKTIFACTFGSMLLFYNYYISIMIGQDFIEQFFPLQGSTVKLLSWFTILAIGLLIRPFGALMFGRIGDLAGRRYAFLITIMISGGSTTAIGILPTYSSIGIAAPSLLLLLRVVQALAVSGEHAAAATLIAESSRSNRRGYTTSWFQTSPTLGLLVSLLTFGACRFTLGASDFLDWGWRIPFLLSVIPLPVAVHLTRKLGESPVFRRLKEEGRRSKKPLIESLFHSPNNRYVLLALFGASGAGSIIRFTSQTYAILFLTNTLHLAASSVLLLGNVSLLLSVPLFVIFGRLSDRVGRLKVIDIGCLLAAFSYLPLFKGLTHFANCSNYPMLLTVLVALASIAAMVEGPMAAFLVEMFPAKLRCTSISLPHQLANAVFGGFVPTISAALVLTTGNIYYGLWYLITISLMTAIIGFVFLRDAKPDFDIYN